MTYYDRSAITHVDGTQVFANAEDRAAEKQVAETIMEIWRCELCQFGALCPVDWYAKRAGRVVGVVELKSRTHAWDAYPTVYLNVRKWLALILAQVGMGVPAVFVVQFTDGIFWCPVRHIDASRMKIGGCTRTVKSANDIEPVIEVPVSLLRPIEIPS